jgi:hypothetical protein
MATTAPKQTKNDFSFSLHPNHTASIFWGEACMGTVCIPYMLQIDDTVDFLRAIGDCYMKYHRAVISKFQC